jgi:hypothetical protein
MSAGGRAADPGPGRGLNIVRALMHAVDVDEGADGTTSARVARPVGALRIPEWARRRSRWTAASGSRSRLSGEIDGGGPIEPGWRAHPGR